jgi:hypothetical protein
VGCYSSSPLKQNLVPRFLSVVVSGVETKVELGLNGCSSNSPVIIWVASKTCFCRRCRSSSFGKVDGWRVDVAKSILSKPCRDTFKVSGVGYLVCPKRFYESWKGFNSRLRSWRVEASRVALVGLESLFPSRSLMESLDLGVMPWSLILA